MEANCGPICDLCKAETSSAVTLRMDIEGILHPALFNKEEGVEVILRIFNLVFELFMGKSY